MTRSLPILASTSAMALVLMTAVPAAAQQTPAGPPSGAAATPAPAPADDSAIVVTGIRRSLQSASNIKRKSVQQVDVVVAEDIGKLPDRNVSEALARIPGVTVERRAGEAGGVFVRGLRDPATTYNGRDIFTAEARNVAPQDFPAGGVAALEVYKSQTADQLEGNLAGLVNVRSRRPFDFKGFAAAAAVNGTYADLAKDVALNGNVLVSNRWKVGDEGEFGALVNASYTELTYKDVIRFASGDFFGINPSAANRNVYCDNYNQGCLGGAPAFNVPGTTVRVPVVVGLFMNAGRRWRPSANAALQYKVNPDLQFYVDGLYQGFRRQTSNRVLAVPLFDYRTYTNVSAGPVGSLYTYPSKLTLNGPNCCAPDGNQAGTREQTNTYQVAVGSVYDTDRVRLAFDVARTTSKFDLSVYGVDYVLNRSPSKIDVSFDQGGDGGAQFDFTGLDTGDLANYTYRGFFDRHLVAKGKDWQARLDGTIKNVAPWLTAIDLGVRFNDRRAGFTNAERYSQNGRGVPYGSLPLQFETVNFNFRDGRNGVTQLVLPTYRSIRNGVADLRQRAGFPQAVPQPGAPDDRTGPFDDYTANEKGYTGYAQGRYSFDLGGMTIDGAVGVRAVKTKFKLNSVVLNQGLITPFVVSSQYTDVLPNASVRAGLTRQLQLRLAYTETRRRPDFGQLNPGLRLDPPPGPGQIRNGNGGNPFLKPITSNNYDASLEYYFGKAGLATVAVFQRDVKNYIINSTSLQDLPNIGQVRISGPANSNKGRLRGAEAQFRTFFDFTGLPQWAHGFGAEVNVTYITNRLDAPASFTGTSQIRFPDVSKWAYNLVGFFEQGKLSARVAYNHRSKYVQFYENRPTGAVGGEFVNGESRLDASMSYNLTKSITIAADVSNILGKPLKNFRTTEDNAVFPRDVNYQERVYSVGLRAKL